MSRSVQRISAAPALILVCLSVVLSSLNLPGGWQPQALITLGYPAPGAMSRRERKAVDDVAIRLE